MIDRVFLALVVLVVVGATTLPYVAARRAMPPDHVYVGTTEASDDDYPTYLAKMRAGARGEWTYRSPYAPGLEATPHVRPLYGLLGAISQATGVPLWLGFHSGRLLLGAICLVILYGVTGTVTRGPGERRCAFLLAVVGSGVGGFLGREGPRATWSYDLWVPELNVVYSILTNVHFPTALVLMLATLVATARAFERGSLRAAAGAGLALGMLAVIHTYDVVPMTTTLVVFGLVALGTRQLGAGRLCATAAVLATAALPFVALQVASLRLDPSLAQMGQSQPVGSVWAVAAGVGLLGLLALAGIPRMALRGPLGGLMVVWALLVPVLLALPLPFARRMVAGWHVPLGLLAGVGLWRLLILLAPGRRRAGAAIVALVLCCFTSIEILSHQVARFSRPFPGILTSLPQDLLDAYAWLDANAQTGDVVLAPYGPSNWLPVFTDLSPWYGHWAETPDARRRSLETHRFFLPRTSSERRAALLQGEGIAWLLSASGGSFAPAARFDAEEIPGVALAHRVRSISIFRVDLRP